MPRSSWGTKTKIDKNKWRIRWCEWNGLNRVRRSKTLFPCTSREADDELRRLWQLHHLPPNERVIPCPTFAQCWDEWYFPQLEKQVESGDISRNTFNSYRSAWRSKVSPKWASVTMNKVRIEDYQRWLDGFTYSQAHSSHNLVLNLVNCAKLHDVGGFSFVDARYKMPREKKRTNDGGLEVYTIAEMDNILESLRGNRIEGTAILMAKGSCRVGEAVAAAVEDVTFEQYHGRTYAVYDLHHQYAQGSKFTRLKTDDSYRPIIIPPPWSLRFAEIAKQRTNDEELYICDKGTGMPLDRARVTEKWIELFRGGTIDLRYLTMTKLRNSWSTAMLWKYGIPSQMVDKMMGHAAKNILGKHYDRPDKELFIETVDRALFEN